LSAIGCPANGRGQIFQTCRTAETAFEKCFFSGYHVMKKYEPNQSQTYQFRTQELAAVVKNISVNEINKSKLLIKQISNEIRKCENTPQQEVRNIFFQMAIKLLNSAEDNNIRFQKNEAEYLTAMLLQARTLTELEQIICILVDLLADYLNRDAGLESIVKQITDFINRRYQDKDLSINMLVNNLHFSSTYLCILFKRVTGKTINQYITEVRINHAKEYLKGNDIKLYCVADQVGYSDASYFTKVFHRVVGMNPKKYKELNVNV
jgi:two-component system response regulator YesN